MAVDVFPAGVRPITEGGTGANNATTARANLGIPEPYNLTQLYTGSITTPIANGTVMTLSDDATNYKLFAIQAFNGTPGSSTRMIIFDIPMITTAHGIVGAGGNGTMGVLYVQRDSTTTYTFISSSFSTLYIATIYGIK